MGRGLIACGLSEVAPRKSAPFELRSQWVDKSMSVIGDTGVMDERLQGESFASRQ